MNTKRQRVLITGARAPVALEISRLFHSAGHEVYVADSIRHFMCRASRKVIRAYRLPSPRENELKFIETLEHIIDAEGITVLVPTCEEVFYIAKYRERLSKSCVVFVDSIETLEQLHHKYLFIELVNRIGVATPKTWLINSKEDLEQKIMTSPYQKMILKPAYSRFSSHIYVLDRNSSVPSEIEITEKQPWVLQEYIEGTHYSTLSVVQQGTITAHTTYPITFRAGRGAGVYFKHVQHAAIDDWVRLFAQKTEITGQIAFDFIEREDGQLFAIECNPRLTSGVHLFVEDDRLDQAYFEQRCDMKIPQSRTRRQLSFPMWTYALTMVNSWKQFREWLWSALKTKDVIFRLTDPLPALYQYVEYASFWLRSRKLGISLLESTTYDIEWNGEK